MISTLQPPYRHPNIKNPSSRAFTKIAEEDENPLLKDPRRYQEGMQRKVDSIFEAAIKRGNDSLVLGAWGTVIFCNPSDEVIGYFKKAIQRYGRAFKRIDFGILASSLPKGPHIRGLPKGFWIKRAQR